MSKPKPRAETPTWFAFPVELGVSIRTELATTLGIPDEDAEAAQVCASVEYHLGGYLGLKRYSENRATSTDIRKQVTRLQRATTALLAMLTDRSLLCDEARSMLDTRLAQKIGLGAERETDCKAIEIAELFDACSATLRELPMEESRGTRARAGGRGLLNSLLRVYEGSSRVPRQAREANGAFVKMSRWEKACAEFVRLAVGALVADIETQLDRSRRDAEFLHVSELSKDPRRLSEMDADVAFLNEARHDLRLLLNMPADSLNKELRRAKALG